VKVPSAGFDPVQVVSNDWVSILAKRGENFVVVKQVRYGLGRPFMEFPCGIVENGETPEDAARRELEEETGIRLINAHNDFVYLGKIPTNPAFMTNYMHYFFVDLNNAKFERVNQLLDEHEKIIVSEYNIADLYPLAFNTDHEPGEEMPALMCTALFLYANYNLYPSQYKKGINDENQV
jgi:8-oxo-dGTP pyrophosphatase MutT (NUDIX family)